MWNSNQNRSKSIICNDINRSFYKSRRLDIVPDIFWLNIKYFDFNEYVHSFTEIMLNNNIPIDLEVDVKFNPATIFKNLNLMDKLQCSNNLETNPNVISVNNTVVNNQEKSKISKVSKVAVYKRERFLSEDNKHPSYQVLNFHNLYLQDEYFSNNNNNSCNSNANTPGNNNANSTFNQTKKLNTNQMFKSTIINNIIKKGIFNSEHKNNPTEEKPEKPEKQSKANTNQKVDKESNSRKSTDMKSQFKSKNLEFLPEEDLSNVSFELNFEHGYISEEENEEKDYFSDAFDENDQDFDNDHAKEKAKNFDLDRVLNKASELKKVLNSFK